MDLEPLFSKTLDTHRESGINTSFTRSFTKIRYLIFKRFTTLASPLCSTQAHKLELPLLPTTLKIINNDKAPPLTLGLMLSWICKIHCAKRKGYAFRSSLSSACGGHVFYIYCIAIIIDSSFRIAKHIIQPLSFFVSVQSF